VPLPSSSIVDRLQKRHQPTPAGPYRLDHRLLRSTPPPPPTTPDAAPIAQTVAPTYLQFLDLPHLSPKPFVLCGASIITIDRDVASLIKSKLGSLWTHRQTLRVEGQSFELDDFRIRVGRLSMQDQAKGTVVEVEYLPADRMDAGGAVLRDFIEGLELGFHGARWVLMPKEGAGEESKEWGVLDTGRQYCELLRFR